MTAMGEIRRKVRRGFPGGRGPAVRETGKPIAQVARDLGTNEGTLGNLSRSKIGFDRWPAVRQSVRRLACTRWSGRWGWIFGGSVLALWP